MISFDDLVDVGGDTEQLENEMREIRLNTQVNRFSIYDCKYSIQSLSSMISTITVADYSASFTSLSYDTSLLNSSMNNVISSLSSLSSDTLLLYNSITDLTTGGGTGFDYWQSYDEHPIKGYNVSERLESDIMNNHIQGVGPAADFYDCTFQDKYVNLTGNEFVSNHIFNNKWYHNLDYLSFNNNSYEIISSLKINCDICSANTFNQVKYLDLTCIRPFDVNSLVSCTDAHIKNMGNLKLVAESCKNINLYGGNITSGVLSKNDYVKINCNNFENFNYSNEFNEINCYACNSNTFSNCGLLSMSCYNMNNNTFGSEGTYNIKCYECDGLTATARQFNIEAYYIKQCFFTCYNEGDVSSLFSHDLHIKAFFAENIRAFRISNVHLDVSAYLLNCNFSNIGTIYLNYKMPFISEQKNSDDTYLMNNLYIYSCSHFDFPDAGRVMNNGVYNWSNIPSQYVYINGTPLSRVV